MNNLSICILALNEQRNIKALLESVKDLSDDIVIVIDDQTTDHTANIAKTYTDKVIIRAHDDNFHKNKQYTLEQAKYDWVLWMDGDETIELELAREIKQVLENPQFEAYKIPRKNMMFGRWIEHTGWYPDYQIRLFQKSKTRFPCKRIHEDPQIDEGDEEIGLLKNHLIHQNYNSISHFLEKLNKYTSNDALYYQKEKKLSDKDLVIKPMEEFCKRLLMWKGYKDGSYGLMLSQLQAIYELVVMAKIQELNQFDSATKQLDPKLVNKWMKEAFRIWRWWYFEDKIRKSNNPLEIIILKLKRKLNYF